MAKIINKTPHPVYIVDESKKVVRMFPKENTFIRIRENTEQLTSIDGAPITQTTCHHGREIPPIKDGVFYIVSQFVRSAYPDRKDFLTPKGVVRDKNKNIIGVTSLDKGTVVIK